MVPASNTSGPKRMQIGSPGQPVSHISEAHADRVEVRGRGLTSDLMGRLTFTEYSASSRSYAASGISAGQRIVSSYNAGPFVAGAALASFERLGLCHIPIGTGNTERLLAAIALLKPQAAVLTPSYAAYLVESAVDRGIDLRSSTVKRVLVAGEPGGGEPAFRETLEWGWHAQVTEAMGIGDIGVSLWGECEQRSGMHLGARGIVSSIPWPPASAATSSCDRARPASNRIRRYPLASSWRRAHPRTRHWRTRSERGCGAR
jgi:hypothetical protein